MRGFAKLAVIVLVTAGILFPAGADADGTDRYEVFVKRNPFALRPPPKPEPPKPVEPVQEEAPIHLKLTGITTLFKRVRVFLVNAPPNGERESLSIYEGERQGGVEVIKGGVDIEAGTVRVKIDNYTKTLSFDTDGLGGTGGSQGRVVSGASVKAAAARPGVPTPKRSRVATPARPTPRPGAPPTSSFRRPLRTTPRATAQPLGNRTSSFGRGIPSPAVNQNTIRLNAQGAPPANTQPPRYESDMSAEEQVIISKATELMNKENPPVLTVPETGESIKIEFPPLPPVD